jgi:hypothetical protein
MRGLIKKALTRKIAHKGPRGKQQVIMIPPSDRLLCAVYFSLGMVACLSGLEAVHLIVLGKWNGEVFAVIAGLVGNVTGIFLSQKT